MTSFRLLSLLIILLLVVCPSTFIAELLKDQNLLILNSYHPDYTWAGEKQSDIVINHPVSYFAANETIIFTAAAIIIALLLIIIIIFSIIAHRRILRALEEKDMRYQALIKDTGAGYFQIGLDGCIQYVNDAWLKMHGYSSLSEVVGRHISCTMIDSTLELAQKAIEALLKGDPVPTGVFSRRCKDGSIGYHTYSVSLIKEDNQVAGLEGFLIDITEQKKANDLIRAERDKLELITKNIGIGLAIISREYRTTWANDVLKDAYGEVEGKICYSTYNQQPSICNWCGARQLFAGLSDNEVITESIGKDKDGHTVWSQIIATPIRNERGEITAALEAVIPITVRKLMEKALRESEDKFSRVFHHSPALMGIYSLSDNCFIDVNKQFLQTLDYSSAEVIGKSLTDLHLFVHPEQRKGLAQPLEKQSGMTHNNFIQLRTKIGEIVDLLWSGENIKIGNHDYLISSAVDITENKRIEEELRRSEARFRNIIDAAGEFIFETDTHGVIMFVSDRIRDILGYDPAELIGKQASFVMKREEAARVRAVYHDLVLHKIPIRNIDHHCLTNDGRERILLVTTLPIFDAHGDLRGYQGAAGDITEHRKAMEALRANEEHYRLLADNMTDAVTVWDINSFQFLYVSPSAEKLFGYKVEEFLKYTIDKMVPPEYRPKLAEYISSSIEIAKVDISYTPTFIETPILRKDGSIIWIEATFTLVRDDAGTIIAGQTVNRDIDKRKKLEKELRLSEDQYRFLADNMRDLVFIWEHHSLKILYASPSVERFLGYSVTEMSNNYVDQYLHPEYVSRLRELVTRAIADNSNVIPLFETPVYHKNGSIIWLEAAFTWVRDDYGTAIAVQSVNRDITDRKKLEEELRASEKRYRHLADNMTDMVVIWDISSLKFLYGNPSTEKFTGVSLQEFVNTSADQFMHPEYVPKLREIINCAITDSSYVAPIFETPILRKDGTMIWLEAVFTWIRDENGEVVAGQTANRDITDRKKLEETLRKSEEQYRFLVENMNDILWIVDAKSLLILYLSPVVEQNLLYTREEMIGKSPQDFLTPESWLSLQNHIKDTIGAVASGRSLNTIPLEVQFVRKDKSTIWHEVNYRLNYGDDGTVVSIQGMDRDITEHKLAEKRRMFTNELLELINAELVPLEAIGRVVLLIKEFTMVDAIGLRLLDGEDYPYFETRGFPDYFVAEENYLCSRDENNNIIYDANGDPCLDCMCGNIIKGRTDTAKHFFTKGGSFWSNNAVTLIVSTSDEDRQTRIRNRCQMECYESIALIPLKSGDDIIGLLQLNDKRQDCFSLEVIEFFEKIGAIIGIAMHRKQIETKLQQEEERYRTVADFTHDWEYWIGDDGQYRYISPAFEKISGYSVDAMIQNTELLKKIIHPADREMVLTHMADPYQQACPFDFRIISLNGEEHWIGHHCQHVHDNQGNSLGWRGSNRNITERKKIEEQLRHSQKMEAIGTLTGGIAHDFNNILGAIYGFAGMAQEELPTGSAIREWVDEIIVACERAKSLIKQILAFSRHTEAERKPLLLVSIIKEVVNLLSHILPTTIHVEQKIYVKNGIILADPTQIHQVLMNLSTNAGHAMRERGGTLTISIEQTYFSPGDVLPARSLSTGAYFAIKVIDTGHGIDAAIINKIFDPFFTTKKKGEGTGLGLSVVHGIVQNYGGAISVESTVSVGTTFTIYLPVAGEQESLRETEVKTVPVHGQEKILIIDDQDYMLKTMQIMLSRLGYTVTAKQSSTEAMDLFQNDPFAYDMIITDQTMPVLTGFNMAKKMLNIRPDIPIILCTGFSDVISAEDAKAIGIRDYLMKPIAMPELAHAIRDIFDNKREMAEN